MLRSDGLYMATAIRIIFFCTAAALLWAPAALAFDNRTEGSVFNRPPDGFAENYASVQPDVLKSDDHLSVGTNSLQFRFSKTGKWLELYPTWTGGKSVFLDGGFFVTAVGENGRLQLLAATAQVESKSAKPAGGEVNRLEHLGYGCCWEGNEGGNRAPTVNPDDDGDGLTDEDTFDGIDNDGDGLVDEDFAAIGDEMVVLEYRTAAASGTALKFHHETSTWSLPHIDGLVAIQLTITNNGREPVKHVRIGTWLHKDGPFALTLKQLSNRACDQAALERAGAIIWIDPHGSAVGLLCPEQLSMPAGGDGWRFWASKTGEPVETTLQKLIFPDEDIETPALSENMSTDGVGFENTGLDRITYEKNVLAGGLSPDLGDLEPGASRRVVVLLVAVPKEDALDRVLSVAHRTYIGDGTNRLIPPVVPVTPYLMWGSYGRAEYPDHGLVITFEDSPNHHFDPDRITFLCGVNASDLEIITGTGNAAELRIRGVSAERLQKKGGERIILRGRDDTGAFFDALLSPAGEGRAGAVTAADHAEEYWQTAGKLPEAFLSSSPNPFRGQTTVFYEVPLIIEKENGTGLRFEGSVETSLKVFDVTGRLVDILVDEVASPSRYQVGWQAIDENGSSVASGVYYIKLQIGKRYITKRLILLK